MIIRERRTHKSIDYGCNPVYVELEPSKLELGSGMKKWGKILTIFFAVIFLWTLLPITIYMWVKGSKKKKIIERYMAYLQCFTTNVGCDISTLERVSNANRKTVLKDLDFLIKKSYFKKGFIVNNRYLYLSKELYENEYLNQDEYEYVDETISVIEKYVVEKKSVKESTVGIEDTKKGNFEEKEEIVNRLESFEHNFNGRIKLQILEIKELVITIYDNSNESDRNLSSLKKFRTKYLSDLIILLEKYEKFINLNISEKQKQKLKDEIEEFLDGIIVSLRGMVDRIMEDDFIDMKSEIDVLKTMIKQEGLIDTELGHSDGKINLQL